LLESSKAKAERDSLSTVLALQRLVTVLDKQTASALSSLKVYKEELVQVRELHKVAVAEALELKERAAAQVHRFSRIPTDVRKSAPAVGFEVSAEESYPEVESKVDENIEDEETVAELTSLRDTVKQEMAKYLQLAQFEASIGWHSSDHLDVETSPRSLPTVETNPNLSFIMSEARARTTSERIALDLAESRRKLESLRFEVPSSSSRRQRF
jgi:hypothetical protein